MEPLTASLDVSKASLRVLASDSFISSGKQHTSIFSLFVKFWQVCLEHANDAKLIDFLISEGIQTFIYSPALIPLILQTHIRSLPVPFHHLKAVRTNLKRFC